MDTEDQKPEESEAEVASVDATEEVEQVEQPEEVTTPETESEKAPEPQTKPGLKQKLAKWKTTYLAHKKISIPATIVALLLIIGAVPATRYPVLGLAMKKNFSATVVDSKTNKPVSSVDVTLDGKTAKTGQDGKVTFSKIPVGKYQLQVSKKYYQDATSNAFVPIKGSGSGQISINATGRQVKIQVVNKITNKPIKDAELSAADTEVKTDGNGEATIVLPASADTQKASVTANGYNKFDSNVKVTESDAVDSANKFQITPSGKVYFLSKRTGKINVMNSDLDGTNQTVIVAGTGAESDTDTVLLASQDWKYLAFKSKRDEHKDPVLYLIDTANGNKMTTTDEAVGTPITFTMVGWSGHNFVYQVDRSLLDWQPKKQSLKSYNAESDKITIIDDTAAEGTGASSYSGIDYRHEYYGTTIVVGETINFTKSWVSGIYTADGSALAGKQSNIYSVSVTGQNRKTVKSFDANKVSFIESRLYKPKEVYYRVFVNGVYDYYELDDANFSQKGDLGNEFTQAYPTYLYSPSNSQTFWAESRDGKNTLFVGDNEGDHGTTIASLSDYTTYGWFTNDYLLLSKNSSELYITGVAGLMDTKDQNATGVPLKITDYHKPSTNFYGYGGGYGGL